MANVFSGDNTCRAVWLFEAAPGFAVDSQGNNDLTNTGADVEAVVIKEGTQSAKFVNANNDLMNINDTSLDTGYPLRAEDGASVKKDISLATWLYLTEVPSVLVGRVFIYSKNQGVAGGRSFEIPIELTDKVSITKGYNAGASVESDIFPTAIVKDRWYHLEVGYRESDKSYYMQIWDDTAGAYIGTGLSDVFAQTTHASTVPLRLGRHSGGGGTLDGYLDEFIVWNIKKTPEDMTKVKEGTYYWKDFSNLSLNLNTQLNMLGGG